jgi:hypothetical protein
MMTLRTDQMAARTSTCDRLLSCVYSAGRGRVRQHDRCAERSAGTGVLEGLGHCGGRRVARSPCVRAGVPAAPRNGAGALASGAPPHRIRSGNPDAGNALTLCKKRRPRESSVRSTGVTRRVR